MKHQATEDQHEAQENKLIEECITKYNLQVSKDIFRVNASTKKRKIQDVNNVKESATKHAKLLRQSKSVQQLFSDDAKQMIITMIQDLPLATKKRTAAEETILSRCDEMIEYANEDPEEYFKTVKLRTDLDKLALALRQKQSLIVQLKTVIHEKLNTVPPEYISFA